MRSTGVTRRPCTIWYSGRTVRCTASPARLRRAAPAVMTSITASKVLVRRCRYAAVEWLATASGPATNSAARIRPRSDNAACPTA